MRAQHTGAVHGARSSAIACCRLLMLYRGGIPGLGLGLNRHPERTRRTKMLDFAQKMLSEKGGKRGAGPAIHRRPKVPSTTIFRGGYMIQVRPLRPAAAPQASSDPGMELRYYQLQIKVPFE
jgi:hypothetical protein